MPAPEKVYDFLLPRWLLMIPFRPDLFMALSRILEHGRNWQRTSEAFPPGVKLFVSWSERPDSALGNEIVLLKDVRSTVAEMGLASTVDQIDHIVSQYEHGNLNWKVYTEMQTEFYNRFLDDLARCQCFVLAPEKLDCYKNAVEYFGKQVNASFPSAQRDTENAAKCYAFGRDTACVFHLMRVMEIGLRALGKSLNNPDLDPTRNPSWDAILKKCGHELTLPIKDRSAEWRQDDQFYSEATANLRAVKNAWRNPSLHVGSDYDDEQSLEILGAVKGFMRHLATKLKE